MLLCHFVQLTSFSVFALPWSLRAPSNPPSSSSSPPITGLQGVLSWFQLPLALHSAVMGHQRLIAQKLNSFLQLEKLCSIIPNDLSSLKHIYSHLGLDLKVRQLRHKCTIMLLITTTKFVLLKLWRNLYKKKKKITFSIWHVPLVIRYTITWEHWVQKGHALLPHSLLFVNNKNELLNIKHTHQ